MSEYDINFKKENMKNLKSVIFIALLIGIFSFSEEIKAQESQLPNISTDSIYVYGVCNMCKTRIENAALIKGVKKVNWNKQTQYLTVIYKTAKVSMKDIEDEVVAAGHDTKNKKASDKKYNALPGCCAYRSDEIEIH